MNNNENMQAPQKNVKPIIERVAFIIFLISVALLFMGLILIRGKVERELWFKTISMTLILLTPLVLIGLILSIITKVKYKKLGWLIVVNVLLALTLGAFYFLMWAAAFSPW